MCTALVQLDPGGAWPVLVAFVRDEDRGRETREPGFWWPEQPTVLGGRDERAGGTWLAVDVRARRVALLLNHLAPDSLVPSLATPTSRGGLPLAALREAGGFDLEPLPLDTYEPFNLVHLDGEQGAWWRWSGLQLDRTDLGAGLHLVASRTLSIPGERERRADQLARFGVVPRPDPDPSLSPQEAWGPWIELLDGRQVQPDDMGALSVRSVSERPGFGTVGASLVALGADGRTRFDVNRTTDLDPAAWQQVATSVTVPAR